MGEQRRRWSADHRWQHPGGFCTRAGGAAVRDSGARSMEDARAACFGQLAVPLFWPHRGGWSIKMSRRFLSLLINRVAFFSLGRNRFCSRARSQSLHICGKRTLI